MHAGYLDGRNPRGREISYEQAAFRTVRALSDIYMHSGDWNLDDAMRFCVEKRAAWRVAGGQSPPVV